MIPGPGKGGLIPLKYGHFWYLPVSFEGGVFPDFMMSVDFGENFHPWASECLGYLFGRWQPEGWVFRLPWIFGGCRQYKGTWRIITSTPSKQAPCKKAMEFGHWESGTTFFGIGDLHDHHDD